MATDQRNLPAFFNADADFQSYCQGIAAQIVVAGLVKTSDTGQINNATVTKPSAGNTAQGYEIYKFNDSLQAGSPIFIKVEYGSGAAADRPSLWITVGTGSNGSGTLTGQVGARTQARASASKSSGVTLPSYCCGRSDGIAMMVNYDNAANTFAFTWVVERTKDGNGNATTDGIITFVNACGAAGNESAQVIPFSGTVPGAALQMVGMMATSTVTMGGGASLVGANVTMLPYIALLGKVLFGLMVGVFKASDLTQQVSVAASMLGSSHTYMPFTQLNQAQGGVVTPGTAVEGLAILWE